jgi:hypothetical protein
MFVREMDIEMPRLESLFRSRLNSLKFGMATFVVFELSMLLWLVNRHLEYLGFVQEALKTGLPAPPAIPPHDVLSLVAFSLPDLAILYYVYRLTSRAFIEYRLRLEMARLSPRLAESYASAYPLIYLMRDLLDKTTKGLVVMLVLVLPFVMQGVTFLILFSIALDIFTDLARALGSVSDWMMIFYGRRFILYGVNAVLPWFFLAWSALDCLKTYRMRRIVSADAIYSSETTSKYRQEWEQFARDHRNALTGVQ